MPNILNLPDDAQHFFPAHGWIQSESGVRHLRLPILRAFRYGQLGFAKLQRLPNAGALGQFVSLPSTLRLLGLALRDLHDQILIVKANADAAFFDKEPSPARDEAFNRQRESIEHSEVLLIAAFTLLRRLGDDLMYGLRPILFEHWRSAPPKLPEAIKLAESGKLSGLKPYCDVDSLERILIDKTEWLGLLRDKGGIRDILVHKQHMLGMGVSGTRPENSEHTIWRVYANPVCSDGGRSPKYTRPVVAQKVHRRGVCIHGIPYPLDRRCDELRARGLHGLVWFPQQCYRLLACHSRGNLRVPVFLREIGAHSGGHFPRPDSSCVEERIGRSMSPKTDEGSFAIPDGSCPREEVVRVA